MHFAYHTKHITGLKSSPNFALAGTLNCIEMGGTVNLVIFAVD